jgi:RHS repeat-associated protein
MRRRDQHGSLGIRGTAGRRRGARWLLTGLLALGCATTATSSLGAGDPAGDARRAVEREQGRDAQWRSSAAREERRRSRRAHSGLTAAQARQLVRDELAHPLARAGDRPLLGREVVKIIGPTRALVRTEGGQRRMVVASGPLAGRRDGEPAPLDLGLQERTRSFTPIVPATPLEIPKRLEEGVAIGAGGLRVTVAHDGSVAAGEAVGGGVVYANSGEDEDVVVRPLDEGAEIFKVLRSELSSQRLDLTMHSDGPVALRKGKHGGFEVTQAGRVIAHIAEVRAFDADGRTVPATAELDGDTLRATVEHRDGDFRYPIVVDPAYDTYTWECANDVWGWCGPNFAGWQKHRPAPEHRWSLDTYQGGGYLGSGLYIRTWDNYFFPDTERGYFYYKAQGDSRIVSANFERLSQDNVPDFYVCLFTGIDTPGSWQSHSMQCDQNEMDFKHPHTSWGTPGNRALFGSYMWHSGNRAYWINHLGYARLEIVDDDWPTMTNDVPAHWTADRTWKATAADGGLGVKSASFTGAPSYTSACVTHDNGGACPPSKDLEATYDEGVTTLEGAASDAVGQDHLMGRGLQRRTWDNNDYSGNSLNYRDPHIEEAPGSSSDLQHYIGVDDFSVKWLGEIKPRYTETYTFRTEHDDHAHLFINGQSLFNSYCCGNSRTITLEAGKRYSIDMRWREFGGNAHARLYWKSARQVEEIVPKSRLYPPSNGWRRDIFEGVNFNARVVSGHYFWVDDNWGSQRPDIRIVGDDNWAVRYSGVLTPRFSETYTFHQTADDTLAVKIRPLGSTTWTPLASGTGTYAMQAGQKYEVVADYQEFGGLASVKLEWSSPSQVREVIPASQVTPPAADTPNEEAKVDFSPPIVSPLSGTMVTQKMSPFDQATATVHVHATDGALTTDATKRSGVYSAELYVGGQPASETAMRGDQKITQPCPESSCPIDRDLTFDPVPLNDGEYKVKVKVTDHSNPANSAFSEEHTVIVDHNKPPAPTLSPDPAQDPNVKGWHKADAPRPLTTITASDAGSGIRYIGVSVPWTPTERQSQHFNQTCGQRCPSPATAEFRYGPGTSELLPKGPLPEGRNKMITWAEDKRPDSSSPWTTWDYGVDRSGPENTPSGSLYDARGTVIGRRRQLTFTLHGKDGTARPAGDDSDAARAKERSGLRRIEFFSVYENPTVAPAQWQRVPIGPPKDVPCDAGNCAFDHTVTWNVSNATTYPGGTYQIIAASKDEAGNPTETTFKVTIDKDPPPPATLTLSGGSTSGAWNPGTDLRVVADDRVAGVNGSGIKRIQIKPGAGTVVPYEQACGTGACPQTFTVDHTFDYSTWSDGIHTVEVTAIDDAGNPTTKTFTIKIDRVLPTVEQTSHTNVAGWHRATDPDAKSVITGRNPGSGISKLELDMPWVDGSGVIGRRILPAPCTTGCIPNFAHEFTYGPGKPSTGYIPDGRNRMTARAFDNLPTPRASLPTEWDYAIDRDGPLNTPSNSLYDARGTVIGRRRQLSLTLHGKDGTARPAGDNTDAARAKERSGVRRIEFFSVYENPAQTPDQWQRVPIGTPKDVACPAGNCALDHTVTWNVSSDATYPAGTYQIIAASKDEAGNPTETTFKVTIDKDPPPPATLTPSGGSTSGAWNPGTDLRVGADDRVAGVNGSGIKRIQVKVGAGAPVTYEQDCGTGACPQTYVANHTFDYSTWTEGPHTVTVSATDDAGNTTTKTFTIKIDRVLPTAEATHANVDGWHKASDAPARTTITGRNAGSGIKTVDIRGPWLDGQGNVIEGRNYRDATCAPDCPEVFTWTFSYDAGVHTYGKMPEGRNRLLGRAFDNASPQRTSEDVAWDYRVDRSGPRNTLTGSLWDARGQALGRKSYRLDVLAQDGTGAADDSAAERAKERSGARKITVHRVHEDPSTPSAEWPRVPVGTIDEPCPPAGNCERTLTVDVDATELPAGVHQIVVVSEDQLGHTTDASFKVTVDSAGPDVDLSGPATQPVDPGDVLHIEANDHVDGFDGSGVKSIEVKVDGVRHEIYTRSCGAGACPQTWSLDHDFAGTLGEGAHTIEVLATDDANNVGRETATVYAVDLEAVETSRLGLEDFFHYHSTETGAGSRVHVNADNGNVVWHSTPVVNPGRGLSSVLNLTYNSQDRGGFLAQQLDSAGSPLLGAPLAELVGLAYGEAGHGFSLGISGLTRLNEPLAGVATAMVTGEIVMTDPDGTRHKFTDPNHDGIFDEPPGVHLRLRRFSDSDEERRWAITRPDGSTFFFDASGYATRVEDRNGNVIAFEYQSYDKVTGSACPSIPLAGMVCAKRVINVIDAAGVADPMKKSARSIGIEYYDGGVLTLPDGTSAVDPGLSLVGGKAGRIKTIVDHANRLTKFTYDDRGYLTRLDQGAVRTGPGSEDTADERSFDLGYSGTAPNRMLSSIEDPNGNATTIEYEAATDAPLRPVGRRAKAVIDRRSTRWSLTFADRADQAGRIMTVSDPTGRSTSTRTDEHGRPDRLVDGRGTATTLAWDENVGRDNNVTTMKEAAGTADEAVTKMAYNAHGQLTAQTDAENRVTTLEYEASRGKHIAATGVDADGGWVSDLERITPPEQNSTVFELDPNGTGNVLSKQVTGQDAASTQYGAGGVITKEIDEVGNTTTFDDHDDNGMPKTVVDPRDNTWKYTYDAVGNALTETDPRGTTTSDPDDFRTDLTYDALDRVTQIVTPKRSELNDYVTRTTTYDDNGNALTAVDGNGHTTTYEYTPMDEQKRVESPPVRHYGEADAAPEITTSHYDVVGRLSRTVAPNGHGGDDGDFETTYSYDHADNRVIERRHSRSRPEGTPAELVTSTAYDRRGNVVGVSDPLRNESGTDPLLNVATDAKRRWTYTYDKTDNLLTSVEDPSGLALKTEQTYDLNENLETEISPRGFDEDRIVDFTTTYEYDTNDLVTSIATGDRTTKYDRRSDGRITAKTAPKGVATPEENDYRTTYDYYPTGELLSWTLPRAAGQYGPEGRGVVYSRNEVGDPVTITDPRNRAFSNEFFDSGELRSTQRPSWWRLAEQNDGLDELDPERAEPRGDLVERRYDEWLREDGKGDLPTSQGHGDLGEVDAQEPVSIIPRAGATSFEYDNELRLRAIVDIAGRRAALERNAVGRITEERRPLAAGMPDLQTGFAHDRNGNLRQTTDPEGQLWTTGYDEYDRAIADGAPGSATVAPDANQPGTVARRRTETRYDANGNVIEVISARGPRTVNVYDDVDRLTSERDGEGGVTTHRYDANANETLERTPLGNAVTPPDDRYATATTYNQFDEPETETDGLGNITRYGYDRHGNVTSLVTPGSAREPDGTVIPRVTEREFDGRDLLWTERTGTADISRRVTVTEHDPSGNLRRTVNSAGIDDGTRRPTNDDEASQDGAPTAEATLEATVYEYSDDGLMTDEWLPRGNRDVADTAQWHRTFSHDARGRVRAVEAPFAPGEPRSTRSVYSHFDTGWIRRSQDFWYPAGGGDPNPRRLVEYEYDRAGRQTAWLTSTGRRMRRAYYPSGELRQRQAWRTPDDASPRTYTYAYNANGSMTQTRDLELERLRLMEYDDTERNEVVDERWSAGRDTAMAYDLNGNELDRWTDTEYLGRNADGSVGLSGGKRTSFTYDTLDREITMEVAAPERPTRITRTTYWPSGDIRTRTKPNHTVEDWHYADDGRVNLRRRHRAPTSEGTFDTTQPYHYDENGNRFVDERGLHQFNSRSQLTHWAPVWTDVPATEYRVNGSGSVMSETRAGVTTVHHLEGDQLDRSSVGNTTTVDYGYDVDGNLVTVDEGGDDAFEEIHGYDEFGRLRTAETNRDVPQDTERRSYAYDGLDRRDFWCEDTTAGDCTGGTRFDMSYVGSTEALSRERGGNGQTRSYDHDSALDPQGQDAGPTAAPAQMTYRAYTKDVNGSVVGLENDDGLLGDDVYEYDPYGEMRDGVEPTGEAARNNPIRFQGFYYDAGIQTYDMQARSYRPDIGRFTAEDRFESSAGDFNLQSDQLAGDRYAFAGGNPVNEVEWDGHGPGIKILDKILRALARAPKPKPPRIKVNWKKPGPIGPRFKLIKAARTRLERNARGKHSQDNQGRILTDAGRSLQKHWKRPGSKLPEPKGNYDQISKQAQEIVKRILRHPKHRARLMKVRVKGGGGKIKLMLDIRIPGHLGVRFEFVSRGKWMHDAIKGPRLKFRHFLHPKD